MSFSKKQIIVLDGVVRRAWAFQGKLGGLDDLDDVPDLRGACLTDRRDFWRRRELGRAVKQVSYRDCHAREDYLRALNWFLRLAGEKERAEKTRQREEWGAATTHTEGCSALRQVRQAQRRAGLNDGYVAAICRAKFNGETDLRQLSEKQLWQLCYTIRNRAAGKAKKAAGERDEFFNQ